MNDSSTTITTRQAAEILDVHESSIKRWCSTDKLFCFQTPGGHRRIPLQELMMFAEREEIYTPLNVFRQFAGVVWQGALAIHKNNDFIPLVTQCMNWIKQGESHYLYELICYLIEKDHALSLLVDDLIAPIMRAVGNSYIKGELSIGDEHRITYQMRDILIQVSAFVQSKRDRRIPKGERPRAVAGCARSQEHELGALMARLVLEAQGWNVIYLGLDVPTEEFAKQQIAYGATLLCIALMPPMNGSEVIHIIELLDYMYDRKNPYYLVFGGPINLEGVDTKQAASHIPEIRHFNDMAEFSTWVGQLPARPETSNERSSNSLNRSFL